MGKLRSGRKAGRSGPAWLAVLLLSGCAGGGPLSCLPPGERLLPEARKLREAMPPAALALPRELDKQPLPPYVIEAGDVLLVQPADLDSPLRLPGDQTVLSDGTISLGRYGQLVVAGKTVEQVETEVRQLVAAPARDAGPVVVRVVVRPSKIFYVLGEVNAPGAFPFTGRETVLDALLIAGGLNDHASRRNIILSRPSDPDSCRLVLPVCYDQIVQLGDTTTNYQLAPGDRIFVPARWSWDDLFHRLRHGCSPCGGHHVPCPLPFCSSPPVPVEPFAVPPSPAAIPAESIPPEMLPAPRPLP